MLGVKQVGYYRVTGTSTTDPVTSSSNSWDMAFRSDRKKGDLIYLFDMSRGVEVLRMKGGVMKAVTAPSVRSDRFAAKPRSSLMSATTSSSGAGGTFVCPLFY